MQWPGKNKREIFLHNLGQLLEIDCWALAFAISASHISTQSLSVDRQCSFLYFLYLSNCLSLISYSWNNLPLFGTNENTEVQLSFHEQIRMNRHLLFATITFRHFIFQISDLAKQQHIVLFIIQGAIRGEFI